MSNPSQWVLVNRFAEVTGYSENAVRHKNMNGVWMGNSFMVFDVRESRERYQQSGAA